MIKRNWWEPIPFTQEIANFYYCFRSIENLYGDYKDKQEVVSEVVPLVQEAVYNLVSFLDKKIKGQLRIYEPLWTKLKDDIEELDEYKVIYPPTILLYEKIVLLANKIVLGEKEEDLLLTFTRLLFRLFLSCNYLRHKNFAVFPRYKVSDSLFERILNHCFNFSFENYLKACTNCNEQPLEYLVEQYRNDKRVFLEPFSHILLYKIDCLNLNEKEYINKSLKLIKQFYDSKITNYELLAKLSKLDLEHTLYKIKR
jgi:hypothetical protein